MPNPSRFVPDWGWTPLTALADLAFVINTWLRVLGALGSQLAASLQQATQSGPAFAAEMMSLLQVDPRDPSQVLGPAYACICPQLHSVFGAAVMAPERCLSH